jgi:hypothetical protein
MAHSRPLPFPLSQERRQHPRATLLVRVECKSSQTYILGTCENISESGLQIKTQQAFELSQQVTVRFVLPPVQTGVAVHASGVVVRVEPGQSMALEFTSLKPRDRQAIAAFVQSGQWR